MPKYADRQNEDIIQFFQREGWWFKKDQLTEMIEDAQLKVNNRKTKITYKPKKGDIIKFLSWSFTVAE